jgi:hypothetical protein
MIQFKVRVKARTRIIQQLCTLIGLIGLLFGFSPKTTTEAQRRIASQFIRIEDVTEAVQPKEAS